MPLRSARCAGVAMHMSGGMSDAFVVAIDAGAGVKILPSKGDQDVLIEELRPGSGDW